MAYVVWKTLAQMCKAARLGDEPRRVFEELGKIRVVDVASPIKKPLAHDLTAVSEEFTIVRF